MDFSKKIIGEIHKCYAAAGIIADGKPHLVFAGEGDGSLRIFSGEGFRKETTLWEEGGGTMSLSPISEKNGYFLASRGFYSMVNAKKSNVVIVRYDKGEFSYKKIVDLPNLHRFDILTGRNGAKYFLGATISEHKDSKEDWSQPGKLYASRFPDNPEKDFELDLRVIKQDLYINHGYSKGVYNGCEAGYVGSKEGVFAVVPPEHPDAHWQIERLLDVEASDVAAIDIDADGETELAVISPFHGDRFEIYKKICGDYKSVYTFPQHQDFYHVAEACTLDGIPVFIGGARRGEKQLFAISYDKHEKKFTEQIIDSSIGPSNASVFKYNGNEIILCAGRESGQAIIYELQRV